MTDDERQALEAQHAWQRLVELRLNPVRGTFDAAHLKEINRRIFQDLPSLGFHDVTPGQYRPAIPKDYDWNKTRYLASRYIHSTVVYSRMDVDSQQQIDRTLAAVNVGSLRQLEPEAFTQAIGKLYAELDYLHPFPDGNSRTLREFSRQLAEASGYALDWERFNRSPDMRDVLCIARDLGVNALALPHIQGWEIKRDVVRMLDTFEGSRPLPDLLRAAISPIADREKSRATPPAERPDKAPIKGQER